MKTAGPPHRAARPRRLGPFVSMIFSGLPNDRSDVLAVERRVMFPSLEAIDDLDPVDHLAVLNDFRTGPLDDQIVQVHRQQLLDGDLGDESLAKPKYKRPPEIDCNHREDGIFKICIVQIASLSDLHKLKGGNSS